MKDKFIAAVNRENGMRFSSWSDFQIQHMLDMMTAVIELSTRHCAMHGYTKFLEQVRIFGRTGMMFNMSGVPSATGLKEDGSLDFSPTDSVLVFGQDGEYDAIRARDEFPETAGLQCIGISAEHIQALLDSDIIDYIIPYHTSGLNATLRRMAQISNWDDFTAFQNAKQDPSIRFDPSVHDRETWHKEPVFSEFFNAAKHASNGYRAGEKGVVTMRRAADLYKQMCRERGMMPKFSWGNSKVNADFSSDPNYWKLLIDRKMINQKTGALIEQMVQEAVDAYDPTLQDRALNYVRDHLDELPQRIADLKKAGAVKKVTSRKTNKAAKTLQAGPVAAVSAANAIPQLSARAEEDGSKKAATTGGSGITILNAAKYSQRDLSTVTRDEVEQAIVDAKSPKNYSDRDYIPYRAHTPPILIHILNERGPQPVQMQDLPMIAPANKIRDAQKPDQGYRTGRPRFHGFKESDILYLSEQMGDPEYIFWEPPQESNHYKGRYGELIAFPEYDADDAVTFYDLNFHVNPEFIKGFRGQAYNVTVTEFKIDGGVEGAMKYLDNHDVNVLYSKENEGDLVKKLPADVPFAVEQDALTNKVTQGDEKSKGKVQKSTRNLGYHAGDLGKAEFLKQQGRYRGTGHFGTGTYFVGVEEKVTKDSHYGKRPQHAVDFSDYNLYKVRNDRDGYRLHDALKIIDGGIKREWINPAMDEQFNIINPTGYYDLARSKYGEEWAHGDNLVNAMREYAADNGIKVKTLDEFKADEGNGIDDSDVMYYYEDYVKETVKEEIDKVNAQYHEFRDAIFDMNLLFGFKRGKIASALKAVADYQDVTPRDARADSYATVFMKNMGYGGVNVNGNGLNYGDHQETDRIHY